MSDGALRDGALRQVVADARRRDPSAAAVAVHAPSWSGRPTLALEGGEQVPVHWCRSVLELRERLAAAGDDPVVLVTDRDERELGEDVLARLARGRLLRVGLWEPVKAQLRVRDVAPRVRGMEWLPDALARLPPPESGYPPAPSGILTEEHALGCLCLGLLGKEAPSASELLAAVAGGPRSATLADEPEPVVAAVAEYLAGRIGPVAPVVLACGRAGHGHHAVALGLVCGVVFAEPWDRERDSALAEAAVRLERYVGGERIGRDAGIAWTEASSRLLRGAPELEARAWERDAERLLEDLGVAARAELSDELAAGLAGRLEGAGEALRRWLEDGGAEAGTAALEAIERVRRHRTGHGERVERLEYAARLVEWIHRPEDAEAASLEEAARLQVTEGGFADLAREALDQREAGERLPGALTAIARAADERRERRARRFAELLGVATAAGGDGGLFGVERLLADVVVPIARSHHTLVLVLDGMSEAAFRALAPTLDAAGWRQVTPGGTPREPVLTVLPSITRASRASLLCGRLETGAQAQEQRGLAEALRPVGGARLFHKADVFSGAELREAFSDTRLRVVAVVVNAIDDRLERGEQIALPWTIDRIEPLRWLLDAAAAANRALVLASDHGHVLERGAEHRPHDGGGARWRPADAGSPPGDGEVILRGRRVLEGGGAVIAAATERLRYRARSAGYHGGATPQEVVAPLAVYLPAGIEADGFADVAPEVPAWWDLSLGEEAAPPPAAVRRRPPAAPGQQTLDVLRAEPPPERAPWIDRLLASRTYRAQRELAHRPPEDTRVAALLTELDRRGGVAPERTVASALGVAPMRVRPIVASTQSLLNVDGYRVLALDPASGDVRLDRPLLETQFEL